MILTLHSDKVVRCRKLRLIGRMHSNYVTVQVETPVKSTVLSCDKFYFAARHTFYVASEVTLYHQCKTHAETDALLV